MKNGDKRVQRNATIADVARLAGVGNMTVSRLLNRSSRVSDATAEKIRRAIRILHYQPNEVARNLRVRSSRTIGVVVPYLYDPFFAMAAHAISTVAKEHGYSVIITTSDENPEIEQTQTALMLRRQVDGLVVIPVTGNDRFYIEEVLLSGIPLVTLDRPLYGSHCDSVLVANRAGAKAVVEHLIGHGHQNIGFLGLSRKLYTMKARYAGYREALTEAEYPPGAYIDCISQENTVALVRSIQNSSSPPTAFFASNNLIMRYLLHALNAARIEIPRKIAVAGFDDFEMADVFRPSITVMRQPVYQIGQVAANLLFQRMSAGDTPEVSQRIVLPLELIVRGSCGCQPHNIEEAKRMSPSVVES